MKILIESWMPLTGLAVAMFGMLEVGRSIGRRRLRLEMETESRGLGALESTILALLGLLLAFTFSGAWSRFDTRRELILRESNAIGTAWLRLDLVPEPARARLQEAFRRYVDLRIEAARHNEVQASAALTAVQQAIWHEAVAAALAAGDGRVGQILLPALNEMFDITAARNVAKVTHPPVIIFQMLILIMLLAALLIGYSMAGGKRNWLHRVVFVASLIFAIYVTIELEYPRSGFVRVERFDQLMIDLRAGMK